jgi:hypothetical protein
MKTFQAEPKLIVRERPVAVRPATGYCAVALVTAIKAATMALIKTAIRIPILSVPLLH